jgi:hypothetical protein
MLYSPRLRRSAAAFVLAACAALLPAPPSATGQTKGRNLRSPEVEGPAATRPAAARNDEAPNAAPGVVEAPHASTGGAQATAVAPARERGATVMGPAPRAATSAESSLEVSPKRREWTVVAPRPAPLAPATAGQLVISEFRLNGTNAANDEFVEIYNKSGADHTVMTADLSAGYALVASDGTARFVIPNGTVIPARGHYLGCNSVGYSLTSLPAGNGTTATCDATYTMNITNGEDPDGAGPNPPLPRQGIALFNTATPANFTLANRIDAVGPTAEANPLYKEGVGVRNLSHFSTAHSYVRRLPGGCIGTDPDTVDANCTLFPVIVSTPMAASGDDQDTDDNRADFIFVDTNGTPQSPEGTQQRLGAPGPENRSSPIMRTSPNGVGVIKVSPLDPCASLTGTPNRLRDGTNDPGEPNDQFGTMTFRRRFTNNTGANVTRLRFRIVDITTFPSASFVLPPGDICGDPGTQCAADLRALTSTASVVAISPACGGGTVTVQGTTLEQAASAENQPNGGAFNSTLSAGTVTLATPVAPVDDPGTPTVRENEINLQFRFGVQQVGNYRVFVTVEVLP